MTFTRGDIVRLRSDEQEAERCESESSREYHRSRRYIVLGRLCDAHSFRLADGTIVQRAAIYSVNPMLGTRLLDPVNALGSDLIATGERAEEVK